VITLTIHDVHSDHEGVYRCEVANSAGVDTTEADLLVLHEKVEQPVAQEVIEELSAPVIKEAPEMQTVKEGETVKFRAVVVAHPKPEITWKIENENVENIADLKGRHHATINEIPGTVDTYEVLLVINDVHVENASEKLVVEVANNQGKVEAETKLGVTEKPKPKKEEPKVEEPKKAEAKIEPKKEEPKKEEPKKEEPKKEEPKIEEPKKGRTKS